MRSLDLCGRGWMTAIRTRIRTRTLGGCGAPRARTGHTAPKPVIIDGLRGLVTDVHLSPSWTHACKYSEGKPTVQLILGTDLTSLSHGMGHGRTTRFYLLGSQGGTLAIEVPDFSMGKHQHLAEYDRVVKTFRFDE